MAKLGFLGLGIMGMPMARNLLKAGHEVALWSHNRGKVDELASPDAKATACSTPREVADRSECVFYCVGNSEMSRALALGPDGLLAGARPGSTVADCSTIAPSVSREIYGAFEHKG